MQKIENGQNTGGGNVRYAARYSILDETCNCIEKTHTMSDAEMVSLGTEG